MNVVIQYSKGTNMKIKHGYSPRYGKVEDLYSVWRAMKQRCYNKNHVSYKRYGGIGVTVCDEWLSDYLPFRDWAMKNGYKKGLHLDKDTLCNKLNIEPKIYSPNTCLWMSQTENNKAMRTYTEQEEKTIVNAYLADMPISDIAKKYYKGKSPEGSNAIKGILERYKVYKQKYSRKDIDLEVIKQNLKTKTLGNTLKEMGISKSAYYRAKRKAQQG